MKQQFFGGQKTTIQYVGLGLLGGGFLMFMSTFILAAINFGDFTNFESRARTQAILAVSGMLFICIGVIILAIVSARRAGGMLNDALKKAETQLAETGKIKCEYCGKLNDPASKSCEGCGRSL